MDSYVDDIKLGVRQRKKNTDPTFCPVCGITVRSHEIEQHYRLEVERLHKSYRPRKSQLNKDQLSTSTSSTSSSMPGCSSSAATINSNTDMTDSNECWNTYQKIKNNRHARLKVNV